MHVGSFGMQILARNWLTLVFTRIPKRESSVLTRGAHEFTYQSSVRKDTANRPLRGTVGAPTRTSGGFSVEHPRNYESRRSCDSLCPRRAHFRFRSRCGHRAHFRLLYHVRMKKKKRVYSPEQLETMRARMAKARAAIKGRDQNASEITSTAGTDLREIRPEMGGETPFRQQGETPGESEQQASEQASHGAKEALKLSVYGTVPSCDSPAQRRMLVHKLVQNDRMLIARDIGSLAERHVWVGDNRNFVVGMPLNAVPHPVEPAFWKVVGSLPQSKGRW